MFQILKNGGILMIPIIACGLLVVFIVAERLHYFFTVKKREETFSEDIDQTLRNGNYAVAENICNNAGTPCASVVKDAINCRGLKEEDLKEYVQTKMDLAVPRFEHLLSALGTISNVATLLGLLGTVTGNIKAFGVLGNGGTMGDPALLASSIGEALVTTVAGLVVAIPAIIFHNYFNSLVNHSIKRMELTVTRVMFRLAGKEL